jgi:ubiquinone/menaquinone biosynthesis C-methylase UbiE
VPNRERTAARGPLSRDLGPTQVTQAYYDRLSRFYDSLAASSEGPHLAAGLERLGAGSSERVLEIGCGTGRGLAALARPPDRWGAVWGLDLSAGMCAVARSRLRSAGLWDRVCLQQGDARRLPYRAGVLDGILISFTLELFDAPDIDAVLGECQRTLHESGRLCVVALSKEEGLGLPGRIYEWLHVRFPRTVDCRPIPVGGLIAAAGFQLVTSEIRTMWGLPVAIVLARKVKAQSGAVGR